MGQLSGGQLSWGAIVRGVNYPRGNCPGAIIRGAIVRGAIIQGVIVLFPLAILIKAYCVNVVVDIKPIYLNKCYLFQNKIYYLGKIYFCFAIIKLLKHTIKKEAQAQMFSCEFCEISKNSFFTEHFRVTTSKQVTEMRVCN